MIDGPFAKRRSETGVPAARCATCYTAPKGAFRFPVGFIALLLASSELFTENFLVPVTARVAGRGSWLRLLRLWLVTLAANLVGGLVMAGMIVIAVPDVRLTAAQIGRHYASLGVSWRSLMLAVLAGVVITLLTRMQHAGDDLGPKLVAGVASHSCSWPRSCSTRCWIRSSCSPGCSAATPPTPGPTGHGR
jgi:formate/nitrite transporter FocA (FNT family)